MLYASLVIYGPALSISAGEWVGEMAACMYFSCVKLVWELKTVLNWLKFSQKAFRAAFELFLKHRDSGTVLTYLWRFATLTNLLLWRFGSIIYWLYNVYGSFKINFLLILTILHRCIVCGQFDVSNVWSCELPKTNLQGNLWFLLQLLGSTFGSRCFL